jgi:hypothetical protein
LIQLYKGGINMLGQLFMLFFAAPFFLSYSMYLDFNDMMILYQFGSINLFYIELLMSTLIVLSSVILLFHKKLCYKLGMTGYYAYVIYFIIRYVFPIYESIVHHSYLSAIIEAIILLFLLFLMHIAINLVKNNKSKYV